MNAVLYIFIYSVWLEKGYQGTSQISGVIYIKAKGSGYVNVTGGGEVYYDANDLVQPPVESDALFITTAFIETQQTRGNCTSNTNKCKENSDCVKQLTPDGGILPSCNITAGYCYLSGWCPLEMDDNLNYTSIINGLESVTVFMRSSVSYDLFGIEVADPTDPTPYNLYNLTDMLGDTTIPACTTSGCIISINIDWTCDLDVMGCTPQFTFKNVPGGFNYREVIYSQDLNSRTLLKLYGLRFLMKIVGVGGKFSFFQMVITIGSSAAFLTVATVVTDLILVIIFQNKKRFTYTKWAHFQLHDLDTTVEPDRYANYDNSDNTDNKTEKSEKSNNKSDQKSEKSERTKNSDNKSDTE